MNKSDDEREEFPLFEFVCEVSLRRKSEGFSPSISWSHPPLCVIQEEKELLASGFLYNLTLSSLYTGHFMMNLKVVVFQMYLRTIIESHCNFFV